MAALAAAVALSGCAGVQRAVQGLQGGAAAPPAGGTPQPAPRPEAAPALASPPGGAQSVEALDTTSAAERQAATTAGAEAGARRLGETVAALGDPGTPGLWLRTPLVSAETDGRVEDPASGKSAALRLLPLDGPATGGSELSLAAYRALGLDLTALPTLVVYRK